MRIGLWLSCVYLFAVYFRPQELYPVLQQIPGLMDWLAALALAGTLLGVLIGPRPSLRQPQIYLLTFFLLWAGFSVAVTSLWLGGAWEAFRALSVNAFVFFVAVLHGSEASRLTAMRRTLIFALLATVALGLRAYYLGPHQEQFVYLEGLPEATYSETESPSSVASGITGLLTGRKGSSPAPSVEDDPDQSDIQGPRQTIGRLRALGLLNDPNDLAQTLVAALPLVFFSWRRGHGLKSSILILLPAAAMTWAVFLTRSRGGLVALGALCWFASAMALGPRWERRLRWMGTAGLFTMLVLFFRLGAADESALGRFEAWSEGLQMLKYSPVWGVGFGSFTEIHGRAAHNSYVHCFAELGLVGYFAWLGTIVALYWYLGRIRAADTPGARPHELRRWAVSAELSLVAFLAGALFLSRTYSVTLFLLLGLGTSAAGLAASTSRDPERFAFPWLTQAVKTAALVALSVAATYAAVVVGR